jgi:hypothetical protein
MAMTVENARKSLILSSLLITAVVLVFFLLAPALGYPLMFSQSLRVLEIVIPVFLGYLGTATSFVFRSSQRADVLEFRQGALPLARLLIYGPIFVFSFALAAIVLAFGLTNRSESPPGSGITIDQLTASLSIVLGFLAVTTTVAVSYLFGGDGGADKDRGLLTHTSDRNETQFPVADSRKDT